jgi:hypothetical protein
VAAVISQLLQQQGDMQSEESQPDLSNPRLNKLMIDALDGKPELGTAGIFLPVVKEAKSNFNLPEPKYWVKHYAQNQIGTMNILED